MILRYPEDEQSGGDMRIRHFFDDQGGIFPLLLFIDV